ncbi:MAG: RNA-binding protein [Bacteroidota bacterium]
MQIYVGNLPEEFSDDELRAMFEAHGKVRAATIGREKKDGPSQGYGFVDMPVKSEARTAVESLRGKEMKGKQLRVRALKPGDEFHRHALNVNATSKPGAQVPKAGGRFRGDVSYRGSGAIRRGGRRGG